MEWNQVLAAITVGLIALIGVTFLGLRNFIRAWFQKTVRKMKKQSYVQQIEKVAVFLEIFEGLSKYTAIQRCILFHGHNCGGYPTAGKPYTVKAIHSWVQCHGKPDPSDKYKFELQVDRHYVRLLEDMIKEGLSVQVFDMMPEESKLKNIYEIEGVKYARLYYIGLIDEELIFLSVGSYEKEFDKNTIMNVSFEVEKMRSILGEGN